MESADPPSTNDVNDNDESGSEGGNPAHGDHSSGAVGNADDGTGDEAATEGVNDDTNANNSGVPQSQARHKELDLNEGRDFYDDGYSDEVESLHDRITFDPNEFYGRTKELKVLHTIYQSMFPASSNASTPIRNTQQSQILASPTTSDANAVATTTSAAASGMAPIALIRGYSGCGKSRLVSQFIRQLWQLIPPIIDTATPVQSDRPNILNAGQHRNQFD